MSGTCENGVISNTWHSSKNNSAEDNSESFTTIFPILLASLRINNVDIDGERFPFLCVVLAQSRALDIPFGVRITLIDFIFHRLERVCYEFVKRYLPRVFKAMCLEEHDVIDLEDWQSLIHSNRYEIQDDTINIDELPNWTLGKKIRNVAVHAQSFDLALIKDAVAWIAFLKDNTCLAEVQCILKVIYSDQCVAKGIEQSDWQVSPNERQTHDEALRLIWTPCLTKHQLLHRATKTLEKACFAHWLQHKEQDDIHDWTNFEQIELQKWWYNYRWTLGKTIPGMKDKTFALGYSAISESKETMFYSLLASAKNPRNAMAHRHRLDFDGYTNAAAYIADAIDLLKLLGDTKGAVELSVDSHYLFANISRAKEDLCVSYGQSADWAKYAEQARKCQIEHQGGYYQSDQDKNLETVFKDADQKFRQWSLLTVDDREMLEIRHGPVQSYGSPQWLNEWLWQWFNRIKEMQTFIDYGGSSPSPENNTENSDGLSSLVQGDGLSEDTSASKRLGFRKFVSSLKRKMSRFCTKPRRIQEGDGEDRIADEEEPDPWSNESGTWSECSYNANMQDSGWGTENGEVQNSGWGIRNNETPLAMSNDEASPARWQLDEDTNVGNDQEEEADVDPWPRGNAVPYAWRKSLEGPPMEDHFKLLVDFWRSEPSSGLLEQEAKRQSL